MALDTWLMDQYAQGLSPPVLRFYTWFPTAISVGYHQRHWPRTWSDLVWQGQPVEIVRRPTGGRAVLHHRDLTYAVVLNLSGHRLQVYQTICEFLIQGWRSLGVELSYGQTRRGDLHNPSCFDTATGADLVLADGSKFIGSAQSWRGTTVLQHGSMQLNPDSELLSRVFGPNKQLLPERQMVPTQQVIEALVTAASRCFNAQFIVQPLSPLEWQAIL